MYVYMYVCMMYHFHLFYAQDHKFMCKILSVCMYVCMYVRFLTGQGGSSDGDAEGNASFTLSDKVLDPCMVSGTMYISLCMYAC